MSRSLACTGGSRSDTALPCIVPTLPMSSMSFSRVRSWQSCSESWPRGWTQSWPQGWAPWRRPCLPVLARDHGVEAMWQSELYYATGPAPRKHVSRAAAAAAASDRRQPPARCHHPKRAFIAPSRIQGMLRVCLRYV